MRTAAIDLGTNTFHLIIAEKENNELKIIYKTNAPVRLGEGRLNDNLIIDAAFKRGVNQLKIYSETLKEYGVTKFKTTGTSAIRSASNGKDFVEAVKMETGIDIEVISGEEEATFIFEGVKASGAIKGTSLIMDIGGGSTEFIICNNEGLLWKKSYNIGAARLMQRFFHSDPLSKADESLILEHLEETMEGLKQVCKEYKPTTLIGSAGAFETFAGILHPELNTKEIKSASINFNAYQELAASFLKSTHAERENMEGLIPLRVDMIVMAALLTNYVLNFTEIKTIKLSTYDLKMGVLASLN
ncbi:Ppx/GppA phosphatase family protein [Pedobacter nototheniae]|uniref:Ppx/GppA phosphatase family protein n=1 Tax=Pedobacter nototheniae TaxID=2488994 RepID=UPI00104050E4|nr:exopolyphosphatase [Pedobacter nototheniae]